MLSKFTCASIPFRRTLARCCPLSTMWARAPPRQTHWPLQNLYFTVVSRSNSPQVSRTRTMAILPDLLRMTLTHTHMRSTVRQRRAMRGLPGILDQPLSPRTVIPSERSRTGSASNSKGCFVAHIVVVDDDRAIRDSLRRALIIAEHTVDLAEDGSQGWEIARARPVDLFIVDVTMPVMDGLEFTRLLRDAGRPEPILMLTARTELSDRISGLDAGADDYLTKPFELPELLARVRALLRRPAVASHTAGDTYVVGPLQVFSASREVRLNGDVVDLTRTEFDLLALLASHPNQVLSAPRIYEEIWGYDFGPTSKNLAVYIRYLRKKLEPEGSPKLIHNKRGAGYLIKAP